MSGICFVEPNLKLRGFSLIELMVVIAIIGIVSATAFPSFMQWIQDSKTRTATEVLQNSIRLAQAEAVKNGAQVSFFLTNAAPLVNAATAGNGLNWGIRTVNAPTLIQSGMLAPQGGNLALSTAPNTPVLTFNSIGRLVGSVVPVTYTFTNAGGSRSLAVQVTSSGGVRMCDPAKVLSSTNPDGCGTFK